MPNTKYDYLENETLQNIQTLLEEKDFKISILLKACKDTKYLLGDGNFKYGQTLAEDEIALLMNIEEWLKQAIKKAESN